MAYSYQNDRLLLYIHLQTGSREDAIGPLYGDRLRVSIKARPIKGKANEYLISYIATEFGVRKSSVNIRAGLHARDKTLSIDNPVKQPAWLLALNRGKPAGTDQAEK